MGRINGTSQTEFILLGLLNHTVIHTIFFGALLLTFFTALSANCLMIFLIQTSSELQIPMYFFLSQLSFMDICQVLNTVPKLSMDFLTRKNTISLAGCATQILFIVTMAGADFLLLAVMSYDRYIAICKPLQYPILMNRKTCLLMSAGVWLFASFTALTSTVLVVRLPFCGSNVIDQFLCTVPALLKLSCSEITIYEKGVFVCGFVILVVPFSVIMASYTCIILTVVRMQSVEGRHKAFGTCLSHLCVVAVFYGAACFKYMRPKSYRTPQQDKVVSVICDIVTPMLNPLIYSARNRDVQAALRKRTQRCSSKPTIHKF